MEAHPQAADPGVAVTGLLATGPLPGTVAGCDQRLAELRQQRATLEIGRVLDRRNTLAAHLHDSAADAAQSRREAA